MSQDHKNNSSAPAELLPCAFCGCHGIKFESDPIHFRRHTIKCEDCPGRAEFFSSTREEAIEAWNRRVPPDQPAQDNRPPIEPGVWVDDIASQPEQGVGLTGDRKQVLSNALWCDLKNDADRANWLLLGRGYETGVIAKAVQNDIAMAYHRLAILARQTQQGVVLTDEQITDILFDVHADDGMAEDIDLIKFARAIERAILARQTAPMQPEHETIVHDGDELVCTTCGTTAPTEERAGVPENLADKLLNAVVACGHIITDEQITLHRNPQLPGNALDQLGKRIENRLPRYFVASKQERNALDNVPDAELPGMWETADFAGGETDTAQQTSAQVDALTDEINRLQSKLDSTPVRYGSTRFDLAVQIDKLRSESAALARKDGEPVNNSNEKEKAK